jgi:ribosome-binding protein aMBF1 (putative translation factor)
MSNETPKRRPGRPRLSGDQRARVMTVSAVVREDYGLAIYAEAERRGWTYSQLVRSFIDSGMAALSEQQKAA